MRGLHRMPHMFLLIRINPYPSAQYLQAHYFWFRFSIFNYAYHLNNLSNFKISWKVRRREPKSQNKRISASVSFIFLYIVSGYHFIFEKLIIINYSISAA